MTSHRQIGLSPVFSQALLAHWAPSSTWRLPQEQCLQKMKWTSANRCQREENDLSAPSLGLVACCLSAAHTSWVVTTVPCGWLTSNPPQMFIHLEAFSHPRSWQLAHFSSCAKELSFSWATALWCPRDQLELASLGFVHYHTGYQDQKFSPQLCFKVDKGTFQPPNLCGLVDVMFGTSWRDAQAQTA